MTSTPTTQESPGTQPGPLRAIGYTRVSTEHQANDPNNASLEVQTQRIRAEALIRGWELLRIEADEGVSGGSLKKRPHLEAALQSLASKEADVLIASQLNRLSRSVADLTNLMDRAEKEGWSLDILDIGVDTSTPTGRLIAQILGAIAEWERQLIRQRTKEGLARKRAEGVHIGRKSTLAPATLDRLLELRDQGHGARTIARQLNEEGLKAPAGGQWGPGHVAAQLRRHRPQNSSDSGSS